MTNDEEQALLHLYSASVNLYEYMVGPNFDEWRQICPDTIAWRLFRAALTHAAASEALRSVHALSKQDK